MEWTFIGFFEAIFVVSIFVALASRKHRAFYAAVDSPLSIRTAIGFFWRGILWLLVAALYLDWRFGLFDNENQGFFNVLFLTFGFLFVLFLASMISGYLSYVGLWGQFMEKTTDFLEKKADELAEHLREMRRRYRR
jgi:hypothetical protein